MADLNALRLWAHSIYSAKPNDASCTAGAIEGESHHRQAALATLRQWLLEPQQSGVYEVLRTGLTQLCWDTPSSAGRRLIADLIWRSVLTRFGLVPHLTSGYAADGHITIEVNDSPYAHESWDFSGWRIYVTTYEPGQRMSDSTHREIEVEFVLNALLYHDVELGLAERPLFERQRQAAGHSRPNKAAYSGSVEPPSCPTCGSPMRLKDRSRDREPFWGCTKYPVCKGKRPLMPPVPRDGKYL